MVEGIVTLVVDNIFITGLLAWVLLEYYQTFFEKKDIRWIPLWLFLILCCWQISVTLILAFGPSYSSWINVFLSALFAWITSCFFKGSSLGRGVFWLLFVVLWMMCELLMGNIFLLLNIGIENNMLLGSVLSKVLLFLLVKALQKFFCNEAIQRLPWKTNVMLMLLPVGSIFLGDTIFTAAYELQKPGYRLLSIISVLILIIINIVVFRFYIKLSENLELKYKNSIYETEFELLNKHLEERELAVEEFRRKRHDLKHAMVELLQLAKSEEYEQLCSQIEELADLKSLEGIRIADTENSFVDSFINYKYEIARKNQIAFNMKLDVPNRLPFSNSDLCVVLGNALDNAIEANLRGCVEHSYIDLKMKYDGDNLIILVENAFDGKMMKSRTGESITRKRDKENHGIGIASIKKILEKYHGYYEVTEEKNVYRLHMILYSNI